MADEKVKPISCSYIDGVGSTPAIDVTGEIVDLAGIDCSSLVSGQINWEHKSEVPDQVCGKILEYKKIFSDKDCENDRHKYYFDKVKGPYLYVMGRLFDDKKDSSKEVAALFMDDAEHPEEHPMLCWSIEGSKVDKKGIVVTKSIARKMTLTGANANKQCIAELMPTKVKKPDTDSLFKAEASFVIDLKKAEVPGSKYPSQKPSQGQGKAAPVKFAPGWSHSGDGNFSHPEYGYVSVVKQPSGEFHVKHAGGLAGTGGKKGILGSASEAGAYAGEYMRGLSSGKIMGNQTHNRASPQMPKMKKGNTLGSMIGYPGADQNVPAPVPSPSPTTTPPPMTKAITAGSGLASPGNLVNGSALGKESLGKKIIKAEDPLKSTVAGDRVVRAAGYKQRGDKLSHTIAIEGAKESHKEKLAGIKSAPKPKLGKSEKLLRAEQEYKTWAKREEFENFMAKTMPYLTKGEIQSIGQTLVLSKSLKNEKKLAKMVAGVNMNSYVEKSKKKK